MYITNDTNIVTTGTCELENINFSMLSTPQKLEVLKIIRIQSIFYFSPTTGVCSSQWRGLSITLRKVRLYSPTPLYCFASLWLCS